MRFLKWVLGALAMLMLVVSDDVPSPGSLGFPRHYIVGQPYWVDGNWYYPKEDWSYDETGTASWYGEQFQGRTTADGEVFDLNTLTAAHRTLPLPVVVWVTNLNNGRSIKLRVNDRGPFADGRIIDVTRHAAHLLGFERTGIAPVRVQIDVPDSLGAAGAGRGGVTISPPLLIMFACTLLVAVGVWTLAIGV